MQDQASKLRRLVSRIASVEEARSRARLIVLSGCKGGVGTTTVAINLAIGLRKFASRVLLLDANPARGDVAAMCRLNGFKDIDDVLSGRDSIEQVMIAGPAGTQIVPRFGILEGARCANGRQLVRCMDSINHAFDFVVVDAGSCPLTAESLWMAADHAVVVTTTDNVAIMDAYALIKSIARMQSIPSIGCIVNMFDDVALADDVTDRLVDSCKRFLELRLQEFGSVPADPGVPLAMSYGRMVTCASPDAPSSIALIEIARAFASADLPQADQNQEVSNGR